MNKKDILFASGAALLALGLIALPSTSKSMQETSQPQEAGPQTAPAPPKAATHVRIMHMPQKVKIGGPEMDDDGTLAFAFGDEAGSWLGVETQEVTAEKAKELKLPAER